jgi:hypothetical protein
VPNKKLQEDFFDFFTLERAKRTFGKNLKMKLLLKSSCSILINLTLSIV